MKMKYIVKSIVSIFILLTFSGCLNSTTRLELTINSSNNINLDKNKISTPLMLSFYELDSAEQFSKLDYWAIIDSKENRLSSDLISKNKHIILPNQEQIYKIKFDPKAKYLGIIGNFRDLNNNSIWRYVINLKNKSHKSVEITIDKSKIKEVE